MTNLTTIKDKLIKNQKVNYNLLNPQKESVYLFSFFCIMHHAKDIFLQEQAPCITVHLAKHCKRDTLSKLIIRPAF